MSSSQSTQSRTGKEKPEEQILDEQIFDDLDSFLRRHYQSVQEGLRNEQKHKDGEQPELPKMWDIPDPFLYAPPKTDRDPWSILLEPLLKKDKIRCDAWKEEVQNLLIFAGLFSAVVTAFIIESYKTLTPDPNDAIISLLSVIANRLDNTTNPTPVLLSSIGSGASFSPTMSSIRINSFLFISLVLSLATVLVGIIALQWIREYQNYPNLPPKESFALFNMRADGLEKWHVPKIFTALPLLLQSALILFLGGIIDFLLAFGDVVVIPVSIVTVLVLLFLVATTILPTLQSILLCVPYPYTRTSKIPPAQCPYKSPQAHAFRAILSSAIRLCVKISNGQSLSPSNSRKIIDFVTYVTITWTKKTWTGFDMAWLRLRDRFMQRSYDRMGKRSTNDVDRDFPIFDLTQGLMASVYSRDIGPVENSLPAQYHCFAEISTWITDCSDRLALLLNRKADLQVVHRTNAYFRGIMIYNGIKFSAGLSNFFDFATGNPFYVRGSMRWVSKCLHQDNMVLFLQTLETLRREDFDQTFKAHMVELVMRLSTIVHKGEYQYNATAPWPDCLSLYCRVPASIRIQDRHHDAFFWQWVNNFSTFFQSAARVLPPYTLGGTFHTFPDIVDYIDASASHTFLFSVFRINVGLPTAIHKKFLETLQMITEILIEHMSSPDFREPNLLFYLAALYLYAIQKKSGFELYHKCLDDLLSAMRTYKERTIDVGVINGGLEEIYGRQPYQYDVLAKFSPKWWDFLEGTSVGGSSNLSSRLSIHDATPGLPHNP